MARYFSVAGAIAGACMALVCAMASPARAAPIPRLSVTLDGRGSIVPAPSLAPWLDGLPASSSAAEASPVLPALRALEQLDRITVPLGRAHLRIPGAALSIDGDLHVRGAWPALGARVAFELGGQRIHFDLPSVQVIPRQQGGNSFMELKMVLIERRF